MGQRFESEGGNALILEQYGLGKFPFARQLPALDVLDFLAGNPLWLTIRSAEESFGRRPDRSTPHKPLACSGGAPL